MSDHDFVACACGCVGEIVALNLLITAVRRAVLRYARARLPTYSGGAEVAEDVTQEVYLAVVDVLPVTRRAVPARSSWTGRTGSSSCPSAALVYRIASNERRRRAAPLRPDALPRRRRAPGAGRARPRPGAADDGPFRRRSCADAARAAPAADGPKRAAARRGPERRRGRRDRGAHGQRRTGHPAPRARAAPPAGGRIGDNRERFAHPRHVSAFPVGPLGSAAA